MTTLYLGIEQHTRQITISSRDEDGDVVEAPPGFDAVCENQRFLLQLTGERLKNGEAFIAVLEVCGFNLWLIRMLCDYRCDKVIIIQPDLEAAIVAWLSAHAEGDIM